jgi:hypothetical protein
MLPSSLNMAVKEHKREDVHCWHTFTESVGIKTEIFLPKNIKELAAADPFVQLMLTVYRYCGYVPHLHKTESAVANTWTEEQKQIIQGIGFWMVKSGECKYDSNIRKGYAKGYHWMARRCLNLPGKYFKFARLNEAHGSITLSELLFGRAWATIFGVPITLFEGCITQCIFKTSKDVLSTWLQSDEQIRENLVSNFCWRGNKMFSPEEIKYLEEENKSVVVQAQEWITVVPLEPLGVQLDKLVALQHQCTAIYKRVNPIISGRLAIFLGKNKRDQEKNKRVSREIRLRELALSDDMWNGFQPASILGVPPFRVVSPIGTSADIRSSHIQKIQDQLESYLSSIHDIMPKHLGVTPLIRGWWAQYCATFS